MAAHSQDGSLGHCRNDVWRNYFYHERERHSHNTMFSDKNTHGLSTLSITPRQTRCLRVGS